jgi:hypothetical protein
MAVFLTRALGVTADPTPPQEFADVDAAHPFFGFIQAIARLEDTVTAGCGGGNFCPGAAMTRGQLAVWLNRALGIQPRSDFGPTFEDVPRSHPFFGYVESLAKQGITAGCSSVPLLFCPDQPVTRGQMAVFLTRAFGLPLEPWPCP